VQLGENRKRVNKMRLEQLAYLQELNRTKSMNIAGSNLYISQQAISMAIKQLEEELDTQLLVRTTKGVHFTDDGKKVLQASEDIFKRIDLLKKELQYNNPPIFEPLTILVHSGMLMELLPQIIDNLYQTFKGYNLKIMQAQFQTIVQRVAEGTTQIGLLYVMEDELKKIKRENLSYFRLETFYFGVFVSKNSIFAGRKEITLAELIDTYPVMIYEELGSENNTTEKLLKKFGLSEKTNYLSVKDDLYVSLLSADKAISIGFQNKKCKIMENNHNEGRFIPLKESIKIYSIYIYNAEIISKEILTRFGKVIKNTNIEKS